MKTSAFSPPSLPTVNSVQPISAAAAVTPASLLLPPPLPLLSDLLVQQPDQEDHHKHKAHRSNGLRAGAALFRRARPNINRSSSSPKLAQNRSSQLKSKPSRGARASKSNDGDISNQSHEFDLSGIDDDFDSRRTKLGYAIRTNTTNDQEGERSGTDEGGHQERLFNSIRKHGLAGLRRTEPSFAVEKAAQSLLMANSVEALAKPLRNLVRDIESLGSPSLLKSLVFRAAKTLLQRQPVATSGISGNSISLSEIRAALMEGGERGVTAVSEQQAAANIWLPIYLLNLDRPRTPRQRQQAIERLDMIERMMLASAQRHIV